MGIVFSALALFSKGQVLCAVISFAKTNLTSPQVPGSSCRTMLTTNYSYCWY